MSATGGGDRSRLATILAAAAVVAAAAALLAGFFVRLDTLGAHDWDQMETNRYFVVKSIRDFGQLPFWDPYSSGGFCAWGAPESVTTLVSPFLPLYLALPLPIALRLEIAALVALLAAGTWFLAKRYVRHPLAIALVCVVGALNSRAALQAAVGHVWFLYYAGFPWIVGAFDRATDGDRAPLRWIALAAGLTALLVYDGGIYPVPHAMLAIGVLAAHRAWTTRSARPLIVATSIVAWAALLAAPRLLGIAETMSRFPRHVVSRETIPLLVWFRMFLQPAGGVPDDRAMGLDYQWHEYGQYVGVIPAIAIAWAIVQRLPPRSELRALRFTGVLFFALSAGGVGPWRLLHLIPPFRSQHVPSRFTYPALMLVAIVAAHVIEERLPAWRAKLGARRFDVIAAAAFVASVGMIAREDMACTLPWFRIEVPYVAERSDGFVQYDRPLAEYTYGDHDYRGAQGENGTPSLLAHRANVGMMQSSLFHGLNQDAPRDAQGRPLLLGARGVGDPLYRGEAWIDPSGRATITRWTPRVVTVDASEARPGDVVALDQNWDPGWSANGAPAIDHDGVVAHRVAPGETTVTFRYLPRTLPAGLALLALGIVAGPIAWRVRRRVARTPARREPAPVEGASSRAATP